MRLADLRRWEDPPQGMQGDSVSAALRGRKLRPHDSPAGGPEIAAHNDEVHWILVKRLLKRLGIGPEEWLRAVYG